MSMKRDAALRKDPTLQAHLDFFATYGDQTVWLYECQHPGCGYCLVDPEVMKDRAIPFCSKDRSHGHLKFTDQLVDTT